MLFRFIRRLKNRAVKQKRQPQEVIETDLNWIWQPFENSSTLQFSATVKKVAAAIIESSADDIPTITLEVDPRLVIPLCAIQLQDEINLTQLSSFKNELESVSLENLDNKIEFVDRVLSKITPNQRWLYLFKSLTPELQFALLSRLINCRRPTRNDWHNLFKKIEYQFKKSREYLIVLTVVFLLSLASVIEIFAIMYSQPKSWVNGLMAITIAVVLYFLIVLWREIILEKDTSEPTLLMQLGLLGPWTFCQEWYRQLRKNLLWSRVTEYELADVNAAVAVVVAVVGTVFVPVVGAVVVAVVGSRAWFIAVVGAVVGAMYGAMYGAALVGAGSKSKFGIWGAAVSVGIVAVYWAVVGSIYGAGLVGFIDGFWAVTGAWFGAVAGFWAVAGFITVVWAVALVSAVVWAVVVAVTGVVVVAGSVGAAAVAVAVAGVIVFGLGIWYLAKEKTDWLWVRFLSILAFPWFCWLPIVFGFTSFALYHRLSWEWRSISLFWLVIFGFCTVLWVRGKKLEEKARNPLRGILDGQ
ncbi:hypothetical protein D3800_20140 [Microcystis aeruginosa NIES-298]|uniref:Uncharacterized protein n=1 Tax=Microcystis aeruginosa NIES-298 TaxID=449468 RepID=A0A2H6BR64_MICAE|nr:glycine zipper family protein [Microcystis aeruginosa]QHU85402.1 hypothetical protein D3800_20140 [Microcystis aeruginosa NIES-298]GBD52683.1 hypothetical protein BGM30_17760 [Microcystis aeruginosa NIES-298]GBE97898.1 hypothetical protein NIES298_21460 [Microcystis aeruginosa NIES-298]